jgi:hypothetical protein
MPAGAEKGEQTSLLKEVEQLLSLPSAALLEPAVRQRIPELLKALCAMALEERLQRLTDKVLENLANPAPLARDTAVKTVRVFEEILSANRKEKPFMQIVGALHKMAESESAPDVYGEVAQKYDTFVTFNGYQFDAPYLMIRGAIHGVRPTVNLLSNRYLSMQRGGKAHVDLIDQLSFYGAMRKKGSLHMWTRAFGISSPKSEEVNGHQVAEMFKEKKYLDIARYNAADIKATGDLYTKWLHFLKF